MPEARVIPLRAEQRGITSPPASPPARPPTGPAARPTLVTAADDGHQDRLAEVLAFLRRRLTGDYRVDDFGFDADLTEQVLLPLVRPLYSKWFRVETIGMHHVPETGAALIVANHSGTLPLDALMTGVAIHDEHTIVVTLDVLLDYDLRRVLARPFKCSTNGLDAVNLGGDAFSLVCVERLDGGRASETLGNSHRLVCRSNGFASRDGEAGFFQERLGQLLVACDADGNIVGLRGCRRLDALQLAAPTELEQVGVLGHSKMWNAASLGGVDDRAR